MDAPAMGSEGSSVPQLSFAAAKYHHYHAIRRSTQVLLDRDIGLRGLIRDACGQTDRRRTKERRTDGVGGASMLS